MTVRGRFPLAATLCEATPTSVGTPQRLEGLRAAACPRALQHLAAPPFLNRPKAIAPSKSALSKVRFQLAGSTTFLRPSALKRPFQVDHCEAIRRLAFLRTSPIRLTLAASVKELSPHPKAVPEGHPPSDRRGTPKPCGLTSAYQLPAGEHRPEWVFTSESPFSGVKARGIRSTQLGRHLGWRPRCVVHRGGGPG